MEKTPAANKPASGGASSSSSGTGTSADIIARRCGPARMHQYVPIDQPGWARRFVEHGVPAAQIVVADYGFPAPPPAPPRRGPGRPLRVGYVGTLSDYKGVEVFARAVVASGLGADALRATVHGHLDWFPDVAASLRALAARSEALELAGPFPPDEREGVFAGLDLLVVPSLWWENSPLTIHEAWQRGVPVLTSDRGGMAELVGRGGGETFPPGDHEALAARLGRLAAEPARVAGLAATIPPVRPLAEDVALVERLAAELGAGGEVSPARGH